MRAGKLRHRVTIEALNVTLDDGVRVASSDDSDSDIDSDGLVNEDPTADGARTETWADAFGMLLSASIEPLSGRELVAAQAVQSEISTRIVIRYRAGVLPTMRVRHRDTTYAIKAVLPDASSGIGHITLMCSSGLSDG